MITVTVTITIIISLAGRGGALFPGHAEGVLLSAVASKGIALCIGHGSVMV